MSIWTQWLENRQLIDRDKEVRSIWHDTFKALGIGGLDDKDAAQQSLSKISVNDRSTQAPSTFRGKQAVLKMLESGQIFRRILNLNDPELTKAVEDTKTWLGTNQDGATATSNASTTVSSLLQKLFGQYYPKMIEGGVPAPEAQAQVPPQLPQNNLGPSGPTPSPNPDMTATPEQPTQQPQMTAPPMPPQPQQPDNPMMFPQQQLAAHTKYDGPGIFEQWLRKHERD